MIDTGSNKNYISPELVKKSLKAVNKFKIATMTGHIFIDKYVHFNPFPQLETSRNFCFFVHEFSNFFKILVGYETLQALHAVINTTQNSLIFPSFKIQMERKIPDNDKEITKCDDNALNETKHKQELCFETACDEISLNLPTEEFKFRAKEELFIKANSNVNQGEFLLEHNIQLSPNVVVNKGIYTIENQVAYIALSNISDETVSFCPHVSDIIHVENLDNFETKAANDSYFFNIENNASNIHDIMNRLNTKDLNHEESKQLFQVLSKFRHCFHNEEEKHMGISSVEHSIKTTDEIPVHTKSYRYPYCYSEEVQRQISKLLRQGIIQHSSSPWSAPIWVVPKKPDKTGNRKLRLVIDYRKLNAKTIPDRYPIPNIESILDKLGKSNYFSTIDLASGFHQIPVNPKDIPKTAFSVENGKYEFKFMPFGLRNAPATFQRALDNILRELIGKCCLIYMDDIIVYGTSLQEHIVNLELVLNKLSDNNLKIQLDKCEFLQRSVHYVGHVIAPEGIFPNENYLKPIKTWPIPRDVKELRIFLGTLGYYRKFIRDYARITKPLTVQLKKENEKVVHTREFVEAFEKCRTILTSSDVLGFPDFDKQFIVTTDASQFAVGAVLSQKQNGKDKPLAFASRTLTKTETNYSTIEKELLAIIFAVKYFRPYIYGRKFLLVTDHKPLTYIFSMSHENARLIRWRLILSEFDFDIQHEKGKNNVVADGLSRIPIAGACNAATSIQTVHSADTSDDYFIKSSENPVNFFSNQIIFIQHQNESTSTEEIFPKLIRHTIIKKSFSEKNVLEIFKEKLDFKRTNGILCPVELTQVIQNVFKEYFSNNRNLKISITHKLLEDVCSDIEQTRIIEETHNRAHRGVEENYKVISRKFFFPQMKNKIRSFISLCKQCKLAKYNRKPFKIEIGATPIPTKPFQIVHMDIFIAANNLFLTAIDKFSRFGILIPIKSRSVVDIRKALIKMLLTYQKPEMLVSDNEPSFKSIEIRSLLENQNIEVYYTATNKSESNGLVERFHSTLAEIFRCVRTKYPKYSVKELFKISVSLYNDTIHSATNFKPNEIIYGQGNFSNVEEILQDKDKVFDEVILNLKEKQRKDLKFHNKNAVNVDFEEGKNAFESRNKRKSKIQNRFEEIKIKENNKYTVTDDNGRKIHKSNLKQASA